MINLFNSEGVLYFVDNEGKQTEIGNCADIEFNFTPNNLLGECQIMPRKHTTKIKGRGTIKNLQIDKDFYYTYKLSKAKCYDTCMNLWNQ